jgi:hypothetical protein
MENAVLVGKAQVDAQVPEKKVEKPILVGEEIGRKDATWTTSHKVSCITVGNVLFVLLYGIFLTVLLFSCITGIFFLLTRVIFPIMDIIVTGTPWIRPS